MRGHRRRRTRPTPRWRRMRAHPLGADAAVIGEVVAEPEGIVVLRTTFGSTRIVDMLVGDPSPASAERPVAHTRIRVTGTVQGVGFRPFVYRHAVALGLAGSVRNDSDGVLIDVEGDAAGIAELRRRLVDEPPPLARVTARRRARTSRRARRPPPAGSASWRPTAPARPNVPVSVDTATCAGLPGRGGRPGRPPVPLPVHQLHRLRAPLHDRDGRCPTTGPPPRWPASRCARRARPSTTTPADRRFHAQPNACPVCGPALAWRRPGRHACWRRAPARARRRRRRPAGRADRGGEGRRRLPPGRRRHRRRRRGRAAPAQAPRRQALRRAGGRPRRRPPRWRVLDDAAAAALDVRPPPDRAGAPPARRARWPTCVAPGLPELGLLLPYSPLHHLLAGGRRPAPGAHQRQPLRRADRPRRRRRRRAARPAGRRHPRPRPPDPHPLRRLGGPGHRRAAAAAAPVARLRARAARAAGGGAPARPGPRRRAEEHGGGGQGRRWWWPATTSATSSTWPRTGRSARPSTTCATSTAWCPRWWPATCTPSTCRRSSPPTWTCRSWPCSTTTPTSRRAWSSTAATAPVVALAFDGLGYGTDGTLWGGEVLVADLRRVRAGRPPAPGADAGRAWPPSGSRGAWPRCGPARGAVAGVDAAARAGGARPGRARPRRR